MWDLNAHIIGLLPTFITTGTSTERDSRLRRPSEDLDPNQGHSRLNHPSFRDSNASFRGLLGDQGNGTKFIPVMALHEMEIHTVEPGVEEKFEKYFGRLHEPWERMR